MRSANLLTSASVLVLLVCAAPRAQAPFTVTWVDERLTVRAVDAPRADLTAEVARVTGIEVINLERLAGRITVEFAGLSSKEGVVNLLDGVNYLLTERQTGPGASPRLVVQVHSMAGAPLPARTFTGAIHAPALFALLATEIADEEEDRELELDLDDDPEVIKAEIHEQWLDAERLKAAGAFAPDADLASVVEHLDDFANDFVRIEAVKALAARPLATVLELLLGMFDDNRLDVKTAVVEVLGRASDAGSLRAVGRVLETHPDQYARMTAVRVLAARGQPEAVVHLHAFLKKPLAEHDEPFDALLREAAQQMIDEFDRRARIAKTNSR